MWKAPWNVYDPFEKYVLGTIRPKVGIKKDEKTSHVSDSKFDQSLPLINGKMANYYIVEAKLPYQPGHPLF